MKGGHTKIEELCLIVSYCFSNRKVGLGESLSRALTLFNSMVAPSVGFV